MADVITYAPLHPEVAHLSIEELTELHARFLTGEKLKRLFYDYKIQTTSNQLQSLLPVRILYSKRCPNCNLPLQQKWRGRKYGDTAPFCKLCKHIDQANCSCESCHFQRIRFFNGRWAREYIPYIALSLRDKILLLAFFMPSDEHIVSTVNHHNIDKFCSGRAASALYISDLQMNGRIILFKAPRWTLDVQDVVNFSLEQTIWSANVCLNVGDDQPLLMHDLISKLEVDIDGAISTIEEPVLVEFILEVVESEACHYLVSQLVKHGIKISSEKKIREVLRYLLESFALNDVLAIAWEATKYAARAVETRAAVNIKHAGNLVPGKMLRLAEKRLSKPHAWKFYRNNHNVSRILRVIQNRVLDGGDTLFLQPFPRYYSDIIVPRLAVCRLQESSGDTHVFLNILSTSPVRIELFNRKECA